VGHAFTAVLSVEVTLSSKPYILDRKP